MRQTLREPAKARVLLQNLLRLRQIERDSFFGYVRRYAPSNSHSDLRLTKNLLRELSLVAFSQYVRLHEIRGRLRMKIRALPLTLQS